MPPEVGAPNHEGRLDPPGTAACARAGVAVLRASRWALRFGLLVLVLLSVWIAVDSLIRPISTLMMARILTGQPVDRRWVPLSAVSPALKAAVILSEDGQFCRNDGVDWGALRNVVRHGHGVPSRGASTLTMQVAKNLFLWPSRSYIRKAIEIPLALVLDLVWSKKRILEYYFNIAEWGNGVFGAEAAAQRDFHIAAKDLDARQAVLLATALPNPFLRHPDRPTRLHRLLANRLLGLMPDGADHTRCLE
ncbi:MAG TPA: transglycosylase domain-containing protein [Lichenihabitans sp.]|jgi:monofunctional biosynthetic peptidoglycan transglycosylase|nr:transglycosylase domain-containing protein [Lichenihabitans sp.]